MKTHILISLILFAKFLYAQPLFSEPEIFTARQVPTVVKIKDLDNDQKMDILMMYSSDTDYWGWLKGNGNGWFEEERSQNKNINYVNFDIADLNQDGKNDMVISSYWENGFKVYLANKNAEFAPGVFYFAGVHGRKIKIADIDNDGLNDILILTTGSGNPIVLHVFKGDGKGQFGSKQSYPSELASDRDFFVADKNLDGLADVIVTTSFAWIGIYYQQPDGSFECRYLPTGQFARSVVTDLDNDSRPDLVNSYSSFDNETGSDSISVWMGGNDTTFSHSVSTRYNQVRIGQMLAKDMDNDGNTDLLIGHLDQDFYKTDTLYFLTGKGNGEFSQPSVIVLPDTVYTFEAADVNGDQLPDLVAALKNKTVAVFLNQGEVTNIPDDPADRSHQVTVFPNPAARQVVIKGGTGYRYRVCHVSGKVMAGGAFDNEIRIGTTDWPNGHYLVTTKSKTGETTTGLIIAK